MFLHFNEFSAETTRIPESNTTPIDISYALIDVMSFISGLVLPVTSASKYLTGLGGMFFGAALSFIMSDTYSPTQDPLYQLPEWFKEGWIILPIMIVLYSSILWKTVAEATATAELSILAKLTQLVPFYAFLLVMALIHFLISNLFAIKIAKSIF